MPKILSRREKNIFFFAAAIVLLSIGLNLFIVPVLTKNAHLQKKIKITRMRLQKYQRLLRQKEYLQSKYNQFVQTVKVSGQQEDTLVAALSALDQLAKKADIRIVDIRPQALPGLAEQKEILIEVRTEGTSEGHFKFLYDIESTPSLFKIKKFQLNSRPNTPHLEGVFTISQFSLG